MGRLITACALSFLCLVSFLIFGFGVAISYWKEDIPMVWNIIVDILFLGFIIPVPIVIVLNLRDWWNRRKAAKGILPPNT